MSFLEFILLVGPLVFIKGQEAYIWLMVTVQVLGDMFGLRADSRVDLRKFS